MYELNENDLRRDDFRNSYNELHLELENKTSLYESNFLYKRKIDLRYGYVSWFGHQSIASCSHSLYCTSNDTNTPRNSHTFDEISYFINKRLSLERANNGEVIDYFLEFSKDIRITCIQSSWRPNNT